MVGKSRLSRGGARVCAWAGRGSVLAATAGAAMVLFGGGPATDHTPNHQATIHTQESEEPQQAPTEPDKFDEFDMLAIQLKAWDGPTPEGDETTTTEGTTETAPGNAELTYLGIIKMGERQRALMSVDGQQRFMKEGQSVGQMTLVSIAQDHVMIRQGQASRRIDLMDASSDQLGYLGSNGPPVRLSNPGSFNAGMDLHNPSEVRRRQFAEEVERRGRSADGPPRGVAEAKARNAERSRNAARERNLPGVSSDGQEGS